MTVKAPYAICKENFGHIVYKTHAHTKTSKKIYEISNPQNTFIKNGRYRIITFLGKTAVMESRTAYKNL